jgi:hypothetical protein
MEMNSQNDPPKRTTRRKSQQSDSWWEGKAAKPVAKRTPKEKQEFQRAYVLVTTGLCAVDQLLRNAGLGLDGARTSSVWFIDYAPGEEVDMARVRKAMNYLKKHSKDVLIHEFNVLKIMTMKR